LLLHQFNRFPWHQSWWWLIHVMTRVYVCFAKQTRGSLHPARTRAPFLFLIPFLSFLAAVVGSLLLLAACVSPHAPPVSASSLLHRCIKGSSVLLLLHTTRPGEVSFARARATGSTVAPVQSGRNPRWCLGPRRTGTGDGGCDPRLIGHVGRDPPFSQWW
jgi:hypothetical protein